MADRSEDVLTPKGLMMFLLCVLIVFGAAVWWDKMKNGGWIDVSAPPPAKAFEPAVPRPAEIPECLEHVEKVKPISGGFSIALTGVLKNNCGKRLSYVQITFKLYDKRDAVIGTALANQTNLGPGESWRYSAPILQAGIAYYLLDELTAH